VLESVEFFRPKAGTYKDNLWAPGMVLSHSCDFTKFRADEEKGRSSLDRFPLLVAPLVPTSSLGDSGTAGHAKRGRVARYFHLPAQESFLEEDHLVDFYFIQPVAVFELLDITRLGSITDEWQKRLQIAIERFFSRELRARPLEATR
jgi:hypothetical protein